MVLVGLCWGREVARVSMSSPLAVLSSGACHLVLAVIFCSSGCLFAFAGVGLLGFLGVRFVLWVLVHEGLVAQES